MLTLAALDEFQESVVDCPLSIADGDALNVMVGAGAGGVDAGGGASLVTGAGGVTGLRFLQPVPETSMASRTIAAVASIYNDLLIAMSP
jgi:hypothetical protein